MAIRKIAMMHRIFGTSGDHVCREISRGPVFREVLPERKRKEVENAPIEGQVRMEV